MIPHIANHVLQNLKRQYSIEQIFPNIDEFLNNLFKLMRRPQSAKPGHKGYWGSSSLEQSNEVVQKDRRKQVKIVRPDLTTHDFARILPRKIQQDKERLYSEALQLKQVLNEVSEQNTRLKTKVSILEREKEKMSKFVTSSDGIGKVSRIAAYQTRNSEKENLIVRNLKKIVRQGRQQNDSLRIENQKIKKMMKYTKINELEIQRKIILDQNRRIAEMVEDLNKNMTDQEQLEQQNQQMKKYIEEQIEDRENWEQEKQKYEQIIEELQQKLKGEAHKHQNRDKKLNMDLNAEKRKNQELKRKNQQLLKEIKTLRQNQAFLDQKKSMPSAKPVQKNIRTIKNASGKVNTQQSQANQDRKIQQISTQNQRLAKQLEQVKDKLKKAQSQINLFQQKSRVINTSNLNIISHVQGRNMESSQVNIEGKSIFQSDAQKNQEYEDGDEEYAESFEKQENDGIKKSHGQQQLEKYKKDFEQNQQQEQLYTKEQKKPTKTKKEEPKQKSNKKKANKKQKTAKQQSSINKNSPIITQIRQLLTYRMKSQRYPFTEIKKDIESAETKTFTYPDLCNMFVNQPFYLSPAYAKILLSFVFQKQKIEADDNVSGTNLIAKLRQVIQDFQLMPQQQQRQMIVRIAQMTSNYPRQLQVAFQNIRNGEETVARDSLKDMFLKLELEDKYVELIIAQLSLCSDDLDHLNFYGFFERFYLDEEEENQNFYGDAIEEQREESEESHRHSSRVKKINHKISSEEVRDSTKNLRP